MIPAPPHDPALPALAAALDEATVVDCLRTALADAGRGPDIRSCRPNYVRYKPGTNCVLGFDMTWVDGAGRAATVPLSLLLYAGDRAARLAARPALQALAAQAAAVPGPPGRRLALLPALGALAQVFPLDRKLPALGRVAAWPELARRFGGDPVGGVELLRYKPGRKALLRYPQAPGGAWYGKLHAAALRPEVAGRSAHLAAAEIRTPALRAWWPEAGWLAHAEVAGPALQACRSRADYVDWMAPTAELLARLHAVTVTDDLHLPVHDLAGAVAAAAGAVGHLQPALAPAARRLAARIVDGLAAAPAAAGLVHGDFYDDQVLICAGQPWLLDLDELGRGHPFQDLGNYAAHLALAGQYAAREAFLAAAGSHYPGAAFARHGAAFEAAALLRLALRPFRRLLPDWPAGVAAGLVAVESCLGEHRAVAGTGHRATAGSAPAGPSSASAARSADRTPPPRDPALPQLAQVLDPADLTGALRRELGRRDVTVVSAALVRHKVGRRAVLRYAVSVGGAAETWYGKTFASARAPTVWRVSRRLADGLRGRLPLPEPLALLEGRHLVLHRALAGAPIDAAILAGDTRLAGELAGALAAFHAAPVDLARRHDLAAELRPLAARVADLSARLPGLAQPARRCLARVLAAAERDWPWRWLPVHRDFYPDQVLVADGRVGILDLDDAAMSEPALDQANFRAHLELMALRAPARAADIAAFDAAFAARIAVLDDGADAALTRLLLAASLLRLAAIHGLRPGGPALAAGLLRACGAALDGLPRGMATEVAA